MARKSLGAVLERVEQPQDFSFDEGWQLLAGCEIGFVVLEKLWDLSQGFLNRGMEGRKLTFLLKEFVDVLDLGSKVFKAARTRLPGAKLPPEEEAEAVFRLEGLGRRVAERRDELSALVSWLETPLSEVAPSLLPVGRENRDAEGFVSLDDLTARLLSDPKK